MLVELLVVADGPKRGRIAHWQPKPARWGRNERPPRFCVVTAEVPQGKTPAGARWDFEASAFADELADMGQPVASDPGARDNASIAVVVTCHADYLEWLPECLASIDSQGVAGERVLVLDGNGLADRVNAEPGWRVLSGEWGNPNPARNLGAAELTSEWVVWFDADNIMPPGFLAGYAEQVTKLKSDVGVIYPDIQNLTSLYRMGSRRPMPPFSRWRLLRSNFIDTSSCWRRRAVQAAGGWYSEDGLDDWTLALEVTRNGWLATKSTGPSVLMREHGKFRRRQLYTTDDKVCLRHVWKTRTFAVVTLLAPRRPRSHWLHWLRNADLPPKTLLVMVDNRGPGADTQLIERAQRARKWYGVVALREEEACIPGDEPWWSVHRHVARLYRRALVPPPADMVLLLEDDVEPPLNAVRLLHESFAGGATMTGAVAGVYPSRNQSRLAAVSMHADRWADMPEMASVEEKVYRVGMVPGGCTLYGSWALHAANPIEPGYGPRGHSLGWDGMLSLQIRQAGYGVFLDGRVRCQHHAQGASP